VIVIKTRFWNNLHQVRSESKDWKAKYFKLLGAIKPMGINRIAKGKTLVELLPWYHVTPGVVHGHYLLW